MRKNALNLANRSLLIPAFLGILAGCNDASTPAADETPSVDSAVDASVPAELEAGPAQVATDQEPPVAASASAPAPTRTAPTPAPAARNIAPPVPAAASTPTVDPHAGHDMSKMSGEDMKKMENN